MNARVGVLGTGAMGSGMAIRLFEAGLEVFAYNRSEERARPLAEHGIRVAASPAEAAQHADTLLLSLATHDAVSQVLTGPRGALAGARPGTLFADTSTVAPDTARTSAARIAAAGHRALDACVIGNARHARDGELRFMVGGDAADLRVARPVLDVLAKEVLHVGGHGMGAAAKVAMNLLMGVELQALSEAIVFGERAGLSRQQLIDMISASGYSSPVMRFKGGVMARRAFGRADFKLSLMRKDLQLAMACAQELGVPMPATSASHQVLTLAIDAGLGDLDCAAVLSQLEQMAGIGRPAGPEPQPPAAAGPRQSTEEP